MGTASALWLYCFALGKQPAIAEQSVLLEGTD
jgi:hypothetical protein